MSALKLQAQALISYLEHDAVPAIVLDLDYHIVSANSAYRRQFQSELRQVQGQKCFRVSHHYELPCDLAGEHCPMKSALMSRAPDRVLHIHHTPRGPEHVDVELRPILDNGGTVVGFVERLFSIMTASAKPVNDGLVGRSGIFNAALAALHRAAPAQLPVLLQGESGTGKELFARALHQASARAQGPLVVVDCTGLTESLFESELFGHERGAFTGAMQRKIGLAETASGGTLFLDEIGDVSLPMQAKLLRLIETGTFRRVGGLETLRTDFRLVCATHKPLRKMVDAGTFRNDLYFRVSAFPVHLPALRERREDIPLLLESLLKRVGGGRELRIDLAAMDALVKYDFPGNIRELRNIVERACLYADDGVIRAQYLGLENEPVSVISSQTIESKSERKGANGERLALQRAIAEFEGTRAELAVHLGLSERTLYRRLKLYGLE